MGQQTSGGSVVQYTPQSVAQQAGMYGAQAAQAAASIAQQSTADIINEINRQYNSAQSQVQPYATEGVQALDQLNQFLGLNPYNPGKAPTAPTAPTLDSLKAGITPSEEQAYVNANSMANPYQPKQGQLQGYVYTGAGAYQGKPFGSQVDSYGSDIWGAPSRILQDSAVKNAVDTTLAQSQMPVAQQLYNAQNQTYQTDLQNYNSNLDLYNKYNAEGPLTSQQISDRISNLPGYQSQLGQGIDTINADASAKGYLGSGRMLEALNSFGQNTLATFYGNELNRLAGLAGMGNNASVNLANSLTGQGNATAGALNNNATTQENALLSQGNSLAQAAILGGQQFKTVGQQSSSGLGGIGDLLSGGAQLYSAIAGA